MRRQRLSETVRKGEPADHRLAVDIVKFYLCAQGDKPVDILDPYHVDFPPAFVLRHFEKGDNRTYFGHNYDLAAFYQNDDRTEPYLIVEVDGESHSSKSKKINDAIAEAYVEEHLFRTVLVRVEKHEVLNFNGISNFYYLFSKLDWV